MANAATLGLNSTEPEQLFPTNSPELGTGATGDAADLEGHADGKNDEIFGGDSTYGRTAGEAEIVGISIEFSEFRWRKKIRIGRRAESLVTELGAIAESTSSS